jgi:cardiolipin synthase
MAWFWTTISILNVAIAVVSIGFVLRGRKEPVSMIAWILGIVLLPFVGCLLYVLLGADRIEKRAVRKRRRLAPALPTLHGPADARAAQAEAKVERPVLPADLAAIERLGRRLTHSPATDGNAVEIYQQADETYAAIEESISAATHHIHLEYYTWQPDETGRRFRDLLVAKARQGVEVRLLLDAVGCWKLSRRFLEPLRSAGVEVAFFMPLYPLRRRWSPNLRNHRKIVVVDGQVALFGSQNIGDEYRGLRKRLSPWIDTHMRIRGPAALYLQQTFAEDWLFAARHELTDDVYFPEPLKPGESIVQIAPTGPQQYTAVLAQLIFAAFTSAATSIRIATPYFVPGVSIREALKYAAFRGVRVELVIPSRGDHPLVLRCGRSFYRELLAAGVRIYEFDHGVLHSKIITIDDRWAMIGSANMDIRSFRLNYEMTALVYDEPLARRVSESVGETIERSRRIQIAASDRQSVGQELMEGAARLFAPLM